MGSYIGGLVFIAGSLFFLHLWYFGECAKGCGFYKISQEISISKEMWGGFNWYL